MTRVPFLPLDHVMTKGGIAVHDVQPGADGERSSAGGGDVFGGVRGAHSAFRIFDFWLITGPAPSPCGEGRGGPRE